MLGIVTVIGGEPDSMPNPVARGSWLRRLWVRAGVVGLAVGAVVQYRAWGMPMVWSVVLGLVDTVPLGLVRRMPVVAASLVVAGLGVSTFTGYGQGHLGWPWPAAACAALVLVLYAVAAGRSRPVTASVGALVAVAVVAPAGWTVPLPVGLLVLAGATVGLVIFVGDGVRTRRLVQEQLRVKSARLAVLQERSRIARDLHDVVAHHLSLIAIEAQAAPYRILDLSPAATESFESLRRLARDGLAEMRGLLGVLRDRSVEADRRPQPDLASLSAMIDGARRSGMDVALALQGSTTDVAAGVQLAAYRIVQEALSNASRHAPGTSVSVQITATDEDLVVGVINSALSRTRSDPEASADAGRRADVTVGLGLVGMRERVQALGGVLSARASADRGFVVEAVLPRGSAARGGGVG